MLIDQTFVNFAEMRILPMKYSYCTMVQWDKTKKRVYLQDTPLRFCGMSQWVIYCMFITMITAYRLYSYVTEDWGNGKLDIYDVTYLHLDKGKVALTHTMYAMYICAMLFVAGCWSRLIIARHQFVEYVNMSFDYIEKYQERYQSFLANSREVQKHRQETNVLMQLISVLTFVIPFVFGFALLEPFMPENWIVNEILEIPFHLEWKFVPLAILLDYFVIQAGDMVFLLDLPGLLYFQGSTNLMHFLEPQSIRHLGNNKIKVVTRLGCEMTIEEVLQLYEEQRLLSRYLNCMYGHWTVSTHHVAFLFMSVLGLFMCIRYPEYLLVPGFQLAPLAVFATNTIEYFEMMFATSLNNKSSSFLDKLHKLLKTERKIFAIRICERHLRARRPLQIHMAYPFYTVSKDTFIGHENQILDDLVNLLVTTG